MVDFENFAFVFDMDGTLVDNMKYHTEAWQRLLGYRWRHPLIGSDWRE